MENGHLRDGFVAPLLGRHVDHVRRPHRTRSFPAAGTHARPESACPLQSLSTLNRQSRGAGNVAPTQSANLPPTHVCVPRWQIPRSLGGPHGWVVPSIQSHPSFATPSQSPSSSGTQESASLGPTEPSQGLQSLEALPGVATHVRLPATQSPRPSSDDPENSRCNNWPAPQRRRLRPRSACPQTPRLRGQAPRSPPGWSQAPLKGQSPREEQRSSARRTHGPPGAGPRGARKAPEPDSLGPRASPAAGPRSTRGGSSTAACCL